MSRFTYWLTKLNSPIFRPKPPVASTTPNREMETSRQKLAALLAAIAQQKQSSISQQGERHMLFWRKFIVRKNERGLLFRDGDFQQFLAPATYHYFDLAHKVSLEVHDLSQPEFKHRLTDFLLKTYPKEVEHYFTVVELGAHQLALVYKNGQLAEILPPSTRTCYWKGFIEITVELIDITTDFAIPADKINTLLRAQSATLQSQVKTAVFYQEIPEHHVGLLSVDGQCVQVLPTGLHAYWNFNRKITAEIYDLAAPEFKHRLANFRLEDYPAEIVSYFTQIELNAHQVALVYRNGVLADILPPSTRATYWKGVIEITVELIDISVNFTLPLNQATMLAHTQSKRLNTQVESSIYVKEVPEYHLGLLYVEGQYVETLAPGLHAYWRFNRNIKITTVDIRLQEIEVSGQEILTKDKVGLRINLSAIYVIKDILRMVSSLIEPQDYLYRELQFGLRAMVGTRTLDELLENKTIIDEAVFAYIQNKVNEFGIEVRSVGVKDIILPGEMRDILSRVVEAEKTAQANIIRRREETAATRSLLNTARVMEDNPTALRLKELEMLEKVTEKIGSISVYGGLEGLLKELVKIRQ